MEALKTELMIVSDEGKEWRTCMARDYKSDYPSLINCGNTDKAVVKQKTHVVRCPWD